MWKRGPSRPLISLSMWWSRSMFSGAISVSLSFAGALRLCHIANSTTISVIVTVVRMAGSACTYASTPAACMIRASMMMMVLGCGVHGWMVESWMDGLAQVLVVWISFNIPHCGLNARDVCTWCTYGVRRTYPHPCAHATISYDRTVVLHSPFCLWFCDSVITQLCYRLGIKCFVYLSSRYSSSSSSMQ